jgi:tRNA U34 5-methylaminomethyl-2-thiouridine-forming methyltransferase MnmC
MWTPSGGQFVFEHVTLTVIIGDVRNTLTRWGGKADAWFLDGFAPARNPAMWEPGLIRQVAAASSPRATLATYTVAGVVRRSLASAGFKLEKRSGYGRKREMLTGSLKNCDLTLNDV